MTVSNEMDETQAKKPRRWVKRTLIGLLVLALLGAGIVWVVQDRLFSQMSPLSDAMPAEAGRPTIAPETDPNAVTVLLLGSDKRASGKIKGERSDTMMVARVAADRKSVSVISIPRDSWVEIPGHGKGKINSAFSLGGTALAVQTVENMSGVRIDHVAVVDWGGFKDLTDALGGITVKIPKTTYDPYRKKRWVAGTHKLDGEEALLYVRQRVGLPGGDLDRVKRHQNVIRELASKTLSAGTLSNPITVYRVLDSVTSNVEIDEGWRPGQMRSLAFSLRTLRNDDLYFATIPVSGTGMEGKQSVVRIDSAEAEKMWAAFKRDDVPGWISAQDRGLDKTVR
jgi:LCP family protein required for cell wall assembly